jgi:xylan 1,4-beta-xylosidase
MKKNSKNPFKGQFTFAKKLLALLALGGLQLASVAMAQTASISATVDFALSDPHPSMSGFLHSLDSPLPDSALTPLKPAWWRLTPGNMDLYKRASNLGAKVELVVSDSYGYPFNNWNGKGAPWDNNWQNWENHVRTVAQAYKGLSNVYFDIWNEPDSADWNKTVFWSGTQAQFYEAYKRAYTILRQELGSSAMIGGPSYANYDQTAITNFINYCNSNSLQVNFLSWHELGAADTNIPAIATHLNYVRNTAKSSSTLNNKLLLINESVGPNTQLAPGDIIGYLYYLEKGGADGANKACWNAADGSNNCYNGSLDGILVPSSNTPRSAWWAYKTYADGVASRVRSSSQNGNLVVLASRKPAQVLLGYFGSNIPSSTNASVTLRNLNAAGFRNFGTVQVSLFRIPATGESALSGASPIQTTRVAVVNSAVTVSVPNIQLHEEYLMTVTP